MLPPLSLKLARLKLSRLKRLLSCSRELVNLTAAVYTFLKMARTSEFKTA
jgi:hypothetical protein